MYSVSVTTNRYSVTLNATLAPIENIYRVIYYAVLLSNTNSSTYRKYIQSNILCCVT